ncbi:MAG: hypothetical protein MJZ65_00300 [Paludibacteraceae bacterium]|nr:hypothetical protein [Paludibacteraceae bacterium]
MSDEEFVQRVMNQLPKTQIDWRIVWGIRLMSVLVGLVCLLLAYPQALLHFLTTNYLVSGLLIAGITLLLCRSREVL